MFRLSNIQYRSKGLETFLKLNTREEEKKNTSRPYYNEKIHAVEGHAV